MFYSAQTRGFYDPAIHGDNIPADAVEITAEQHAALLEGQSQGKVIAADANGHPILQDPPPPPPPDPKWVGIEFEGVMCSATREDQNGLIAVLLAFQMQGAQFKPTEFHFANGSKLVLSQANIPEFIGVWMPFRQSFFSPA
jgi:hypothetical protein